MSADHRQVAGRDSGPAPEPSEARLAAVRQQLATTAIRYGRDPASVCLLAVSKQQPVRVIQALAAAGQQDFGENYLQEALPKLAALKSLALKWHYIGQIQSNKTREIAEEFQWVHTLDRDKIALRLSEQRPPHAPPLQVCIQVRLVDEPGKGGVEPGDVLALACQVASLPRLKLRGLMCIPPPCEDFEQQRRFFAQLTALQIQLNAQLAPQGVHLDTLSMGMSADYPAAIAAGATMIRIGTAIFGERV